MPSDASTSPRQGDRSRLIPPRDRSDGLRMSERIEIAELRLVLDRVFDQLEREHGSSIDLDADYYWTLDLRRSFDLSEDQTSALDVGQLSDDVAELRRVLADGEIVIWHDLEHLVGVLRRLAALAAP